MALGRDNALLLHDGHQCRGPHVAALVRLAPAARAVAHRTRCHLGVHAREAPLYYAGPELCLGAGKLLGELVHPVPARVGDVPCTSNTL